MNTELSGFSDDIVFKLNCVRDHQHGYINRLSAAVLNKSGVNREELKRYLRSKGVSESILLSLETITRSSGDTYLVFKRPFPEFS